MYALIRYCKEEYTTPIIGLIGKGQSTKVICFNADYSNIIIIDYFFKKFFSSNIIQTTFVMDSNREGFIEKRNISGIKELFENSNLKLIKKAKCSNEFIKTCKSYIKNISIEDWLPLDNEKNGISFLELTGYCHDAHIENKELKDDILHFYLKTWQLKLEMEFIGVEKCIINDGIIFFDCEVNFVNGKTWFQPIPLFYDHEGDPEPIIICDRIRYRIVPLKEHAHGNNI